MVTAVVMVEARAEIYEHATAIRKNLIICNA